MRRLGVRCHCTALVRILLLILGCLREEDPRRKDGSKEPRVFTKAVRGHRTPRNRVSCARLLQVKSVWQCVRNRHRTNAARVLGALGLDHVIRKVFGCVGEQNLFIVLELHPFRPNTGCHDRNPIRERITNFPFYSSTKPQRGYKHAA